MQVEVYVKSTIIVAIMPVFIKINDILTSIFVKINSIEYLENLKRSTNYLRTFTNEVILCRRYQILSYFGQKPSFTSAAASDDPNRCGECDNCLNYAANGSGDSQRDFRHETFLLLACLRSIDSTSYGVSMTNWFKQVLPALRKAVTVANCDLGAVVDLIPPLRRKEEVLKEVRKFVLREVLINAVCFNVCM